MGNYTIFYKFESPRRGRQARNLPYMGYIGMCRCEVYGFQAVIMIVTTQTVVMLKILSILIKDELN